jgi:hypothetical protein
MTRQEYRKAWAARNPESRKASNAKYRAANKEKIAAASKERREYNNAKSRRWRASNPERSRAISRASYQRDPAKQHARNKAWRLANPDKVKAQNLRVAENRAFVNGLKSRPCMDCGGTFPPVCMDFDHRPGETKINNVGSLCAWLNQQLILDEIAKCDLVCSNCHRIRTFQRRKR